MSVYEIVTNKMIEKLEQGTIPWQKPWSTQMPMNVISRKEYRGINRLWLGLSNYELPYWLTFKQAKSLGGSIRKGETSTPIFFWNWVEDKETGEKRPIFRYYKGFNIMQTDGLTDMIKSLEVESIQNTNFCPIERAESIVKGYKNGPKIVGPQAGSSRGDRAYYSPAGDFVGMPSRESFVTEEFYYSVLFHELGHSTGHKSRLNRKAIAEPSFFGNHSYSKEELVAEMTAAFLCGHCQISNENTENNSAAYLKSWLGALKGDSKMIAQAAAQAEKAADYIRGITWKEN